jgi:hypothetical protein
MTSKTKVETVTQSPSEPVLNIYQALARILGDVEAISKDRNADMGAGGKYKFRGIDDMYNALHKSFAKFKVFIIPEIIENKLQTQEKEKLWQGTLVKSLQYSCILTVKFTFVSEDGSSLSATGVGHALDTSDKATNKAQSSALKYCLMQTFLIPTEEIKDVEVEDIQVAPPTPKFLTEAQLNTIVTLMVDSGLDSARSLIGDFSVQGISLTPEQSQSLSTLSKKIQEAEAKVESDEEFEVDRAEVDRADISGGTIKQ